MDGQVTISVDEFERLRFIEQNATAIFFLTYDHGCGREWSVIGKDEAIQMIVKDNTKAMKEVERIDAELSGQIEERSRLVTQLDIYERENKQLRSKIEGLPFFIKKLLK